MATVQEREILTEFIEAYRDNPCLWDMSSDVYRNKEMKHAAWVVLTGILRKMDPDANVATTKKKVENLRAVYFRELKKVRVSRLTATDECDVFVPNLWYFKLISYLDRDDWGPCRRTSDPLRSDVEDNIKRAPPSDEESIESAEMPEPEMEEELPLQPKRKWSARNHQSIPRKSKRNSEQINASIHNVQTFVEPLHFSEPQQIFQDPSLTNKKPNSFGTYVGEQLEQIPTFQRHVAEKLISEILFLAKTGNLNYDSKIDTPSKLLNAHTNVYPNCQSPDDNTILSPQKLEVSTDNESDSRLRTLLTELLTERKHK